MWAQIEMWTHIECWMLQISTCPNVPMFQCSNVQMFKCSNVQMLKYSNFQMFKCSNVQIFTHSNVPMFQCSNVQIFKCWNVQIFKILNVKCQISISNVNRVKFLSELRSFFYISSSRRDQWWDFKQLKYKINYFKRTYCLFRGEGKGLLDNAHLR